LAEWVNYARRTYLMQLHNALALEVTIDEMNEWHRRTHEDPALRALIVRHMVTGTIHRRGEQRDDLETMAYEYLDACSEMRVAGLTYKDEIMAARAVEDRILQEKSQKGIGSA